MPARHRKPLRSRRKSLRTPGKPLRGPEKPLRTPGKPLRAFFGLFFYTIWPGQTSENPGQTSENPGQTSENPGQTSENFPRQKTETSERSPPDLSEFQFPRPGSGIEVSEGAASPQVVPNQHVRSRSQKCLTTSRSSEWCSGARGRTCGRGTGRRTPRRPGSPCSPHLGGVLEPQGRKATQNVIRKLPNASKTLKISSKPPKRPQEASRRLQNARDRFQDNLECIKLFQKATSLPGSYQVLATY